MDCTGIADASTEFEFKIVEFSPMVTAYLFEAGRDYYYIGKFAHFQFSHMISQNLKFSSLKCTKAYIYFDFWSVLAILINTGTI